MMIACLAFALVTGLGCGCALAQTKQAAPVRLTPRKEVFRVKQISLAERQVEGAIAAAPGVKETTDAAEEGINELRPETVAKLDAVAKIHGLASWGIPVGLEESFVGGSRFR